MIKVFCDWCGAEATGKSLGGAFRKRVPVTTSDDSHKLNIVFEVEFVTKKPEHICMSCLHKVAIKAADKLLEEPESIND